MPQPAYTQHQNMDQFPPRMMAVQQDPVHHQVEAFLITEDVFISASGLHFPE